MVGKKPPCLFQKALMAEAGRQKQLGLLLDQKRQALQVSDLWGRQVASLACAVFAAPVPRPGPGACRGGEEAGELVPHQDGPGGHLC